MAFLYNLHGNTNSTDCFKIMSFLIFSWIFFCRILLKYKLVRKIWEGKFFSFWFFSFEEKVTCWKWPDWLLSGWCSLLSKFGEFAVERKEICDTLSIKISSTKSDEIFLEDETFTGQYFHWAILSTNYYIETKVVAKEYFCRLIF